MANEEWLPTSDVCGGEVDRTAQKVQGSETAALPVRVLCCAGVSGGTNIIFHSQSALGRDGRLTYETHSAINSQENKKKVITTLTTLLH